MYFSAAESQLESSWTLACHTQAGPFFLEALISNTNKFSGLGFVNGRVRIVSAGQTCSKPHTELWLLGGVAQDDGGQDKLKA